MPQSWNKSKTHFSFPLYNFSFILGFFRAVNILTNGQTYQTHTSSYPNYSVLKLCFVFYALSVLFIRFFNGLYFPLSKGPSLLSKYNSEILIQNLLTDLLQLRLLLYRIDSKIEKIICFKFFFHSNTSDNSRFFEEALQFCLMSTMRWENVIFYSDVFCIFKILMTSYKVFLLNCKEKNVFVKMIFL